MTIAFPSIDAGPSSRASLSWISRTVRPELGASMFPKSPTCLTWEQSSVCYSTYRDCNPTLSLELPWFLLKGLKCPPAARHSSLRSPNWCTWKPCLPGVRPDILPLKLSQHRSASKENTLTRLTAWQWSLPGWWWFQWGCPDQRLWGHR